MKIIKILGILLIVLVAAFAVISVLLPANYVVSRSAVINAAVPSVYEEVFYFKNWDHWSPWKELDTEAVNTYSGEDGEPGSMMTWDSKKEEVGSGELIRMVFEKNKSIENKLIFKGWESESKDSWTFEKTENGTKVIWSNSGDLGFSMRFFGLMMDNMMSKDLEKGLNYLKAYCEAKPVVQQIRIEEQLTAPMHLATMKASCKPHEISVTLGGVYGTIVEYMKKNKLDKAGMPLAIYHYYSKDSVSLEGGIPVDKPGKSSDRVSVWEKPSVNAVVGYYYGPYTGLDNAHQQLKDYMEEHNKMMRGGPWEVYQTDPGAEPDPEKWLTIIYYPVE